jgi:ribulose-5-phosphate 4-epimerase/fuculose-1-phosphate aldolase
VPNKLIEAREQLARANRMIANEGVLDAFGHVTLRHPTDPRRYLMSRSRAPELVEPDDILEFTLDSKSVKPTDLRLYGERVIHGEIYQARPEVNAVCHHHAPSILPFCISGAELKPVYHLGATIGEKAPFWDSRDEFGDTNLIVAKPEEGASLARAWVPLDRADAPARRDRRRQDAGGADLPHHLHRAQCGNADPGAHARNCVAAQCRRDRARRRIQSAARPGGARMGILVGAAGQGGRHRAQARC